VQSSCMLHKLRGSLGHFAGRTRETAVLSMRYRHRTLPMAGCKRRGGFSFSRRAIRIHFAVMKMTFR
jgi:hypothetical protein